MNYDIELLSNKLQLQIIDRPELLSSKSTVTVKCDCNNEVIINYRSFLRKWAAKPEYQCKSCHIKTYINNDERVSKFKETFSVISATTEHKERCAANGRRVWADPQKRAELIKKITEDNIINPKKVIARNIALTALKKKTWFFNHMDRIRREQKKSGTSILETIVHNILNELGMLFEKRASIGFYEYDIKIDNLLIEIQGEYWHKDTVEKDSAKATYAVTSGYEIKHLWESEFSSINKIRDKLLFWLKINQPVQVDFSFNDIIIESITTLEARIFLGSYHYLPAISKSGISFGSYLNDKLIGVATFSSLTRNQTAERLNMPLNSVRELSRFCIHPDFHKHNFASWFLSRSVKELLKIRKVELLVAFADETFGHKGTIYKASNWIYDGQTAPSYCYLSDDGYIAHKKTIWDRAIKLGISEDEYISNTCYKKIHTKIKHRYLLRIK